MFFSGTNRLSVHVRRPPACPHGVIAGEKRSRTPTHEKGGEGKKIKKRWKHEVRELGYGQYQYGIVMPAAERNLMVALLQERCVGMV